ncbi:MAG: 50S ribosomal protein L10 [Tannerella sp.]|jgi:large subunit ribosomal protein L10|nr:50S ribosomal protein L10 [Tannerella sp.]
MKKEDKGAIIEQLSATLKEYGNFYLTDIEALNAAKTSSLRRACYKNDIKLIVVKNTLFKKALESVDTDYSPLYEKLVGNTAIMFSSVVNAPARLIKDFTKDIKGGEGKPQLKAAYVQESFYVGAENLDALVNLKSKDELVGDIIGLLQSPAKNLISALSSAGQTIHGVLKTLEERDN